MKPELEAVLTVHSLQCMGKRVVLLTGDNRCTALAITGSRRGILKLEDLGDCSTILLIYSFRPDSQNFNVSYHNYMFDFQPNIDENA